MTGRRAFYDQRAPFRARETGGHYHRLLRKQYALCVPPGLRVLEVGCGLGDLLAEVRPGRIVEIGSGIGKRKAHLPGALAGRAPEI